MGTIVATAGTRRPTRKGCPNHPIEFKRGLAAAACDPGVSVAKLALEHGVNTNLLFRWRRQYRMGMFGTPNPVHLLPTVAAPTDVPDGSEGSVTLLPVQMPEAEVDAAAARAFIEVEFTCATVRISGSPEATTLRTVIDALARRS
ncbi:MAG: transposase [Burkholderiales bacterium]|nr:transposase [Burkholderiales bacterium]